MAEDPGQVREAIERDRAQLAETVQALAHKADVGERVRETVSHSTEGLHQRAADLGERVRGMTPEQARSSLDEAARVVKARPLPFAAAAAFVLGLMIGRITGSRG